ncbi:MAG TPA: zinc-dependent alcohol dehydrogenase family protein [Bryobacteraceae bacterium]|jgi:NADPH:quinone reductase-like Zn-dependent oxidoreductase|nr:zinc-dependent alcohol dehydrogenase family protein [Bryobacteraceae bacterium]
MRRIVRFYETGGPEVLRVEDAVQHPRKGEVLLSVEAIGLNRADSMFMHGRFYEKTRLPAYVGYEAAGVVKEVGPEVDPSWKGKSVSVIPSFSTNEYGTAGEEIVVPVHALAEYPARLSAVEAAAIWMQYLTAYGTVVELGHIERGDFVFITAASSSAGLAAIETIRAEGGQSIAITRKRDKREELIALGANHVIVSEEEDIESRVEQITGVKGVRIILDPVAGPLLQTLANVAAPGGIIIEYGALSEHPTPFPLMPVLSKCLTVRGYWMAETMADPARRKKAQNYVFDRVSDGTFHPRIAKIFPFAQIVEAYKYLESSSQIGKIIVSVT